jgi:hypothetical protein
MKVWDIEILKEDKDGCIVQTMDGEVHFVTWKTLQTYNNGRSIKDWSTVENLEERIKKYKK